MSGGNYFLHAELYRDALFEIMHRILQNDDIYIIIESELRKYKRHLHVYIIIMDFFSQFLIASAYSFPSISNWKL